MRKKLAGILSGSALFVAAVASPAAAAPSERACHERPSGAQHGTQHAHRTVPHRNERAHQAIPHHCDDAH